jgi:hypothetical protein
MIDAVAQVEAECSAGAKRSLSDFAPLDTVRMYAWCPLAQAAALESLTCEDELSDAEYDAKNENGYARTEKGSVKEAGYRDRIALENDENSERANRVESYRMQGIYNEPIDYRTDDSVRMEASMTRS